MGRLKMKTQIKVTQRNLSRKIRAPKSTKVLFDFVAHNMEVSEILRSQIKASKELTALLRSHDA